MTNEFEQEQQSVKSSQPRKTWFFERGDGFIFACDEQEAWGILHNRTNWMRRDFKMLGMSDGQTYYDIIRNSKKEVNELSQQRAELQSDYSRYLQTEERLRFTELKDDTDEMVIKVKALIKDLGAKIADIDSKLANINKTIVDKAFNAELEKARGNIVQPANHDIITPVGSDRDKILNNLKV